MHAVRLSRYGGPEVLEYLEVERPEPTASQVLLKVHATSVTSWDLLYRKGGLEPPPGRPAFELPFQLGREAAGEVVHVGAQVSRFGVGDRAVAMTCPACGNCPYCVRGFDNLCISVGLPGHQRFGGYADYVVVDERDLLPAPANVPAEELACCLWSYGTVWHMIFGRAQLHAGQSAVVTAASSGMGTACIQLLRHAGASPIIAVTGSPDKVDALMKIGADHVLNYKTDDVAVRVRELTGGLGADVVLDNIGGPMLTLGMDCVRLGGTVVAASSGAGRHVEIDIITLFGKHINLLGTRASTRREQQLSLQAAGLGVIKPAISQVFPLSEARTAHEVLEKGEHVGKLVLVPEHS